MVSVSVTGTPNVAAPPTVDEEYCDTASVAVGSMFFW